MAITYIHALTAVVTALYQSPARYHRPHNNTPRNENNTASDSANATVTVTNVNPTVHITKTASPLTRPEPGGVFTFTLNITNNSVEPAQIISLTDTNTLSTGCLALNGTWLNPGQSVSCNYDVTHNDTGTYNNTASVTVRDNENNTASDSANATVTVTNVNPTVHITKTASPLTRPEPGGVFTFTLNITNNSVEPAQIISLTDTNTLSTGCLALNGTWLNPGQSVSCNYDVTHNDTGTYNNTASVTVRDNENNTASDSANATVTVTNVNPTVHITKTASPLTRPEPGGVFTFTLNITNNSVEPAQIISLTDTNTLSQAAWP